MRLRGGTMFGELRQVTDDELLVFAGLILARQGGLTPFDALELEQINDEWTRRHPEQDEC
jgi:hypothetical protein